MAKAEKNGYKLALSFLKNQILVLYM